MRLSRSLVAILAFASGIFLLLNSVRIRAQSPRTVSSAPSSYPEVLPINRGAVGLWQTLKKLHTRASLIMIDAHPDDEDGGMMTYESRGRGARVALLTLNRGEGGANLMSSDFFDALGLVRTEELLDADRYYGSQQYFTRVVDYGFSKSLKECEQKWTIRRVLYDAVRVIRMTRPLVITSVFVGGPSDGHGNHQMAGMIAQLAFKDAGNPNIFPDQIKAGLKPWTPLKDFARIPFAPITTKGIYDYANTHYYPVRFYNYISKQWVQGKLQPNVEIPEGDVDPVLGISYAQIAREGLGFQKSQNGGTGPFPPGSFNSGYHLFGSRVKVQEHEKTFFSGIDTSVMGIADLAKGGNDAFLKTGLAKISSLVDEATKNFSLQNPERIAPTLAQGLKATNDLISAVQSSSLSSLSKYNIIFELKVKRAQFNTALTEALGVSELATVAPQKPPTGMFAKFFGIPSTFRVAVPGQEFPVKVHVANQGSTPVEITNIKLKAFSGKDWSVTPEGSVSGNLTPGAVHNVRFSVQVPEDASLTRPYFTRPNIEQAYYTINNPKYLNRPFAPYPLSADVEFSYQGVSFAIREVVQTANRVTGPGLVLHPLVVGPAVSVWISPRAGIIPLGTKSFTVHATVHSNTKEAAQGTVHLDLPAGWTSSTQHFSIPKNGEDQTLDFHVIPSNLQEKPYKITAVADCDRHEYKEGYETVGYSGLRPYYLYRPATYRTSGVNVKVAPDLTVGYVVGTGDSVPQSLRNLGIKVHFLNPQNLATGDLSKYDVIVMGIRAYAVRKDVQTYNSRILNYVKRGGVVIVQYETPQYDHDFGPYPYKMTNNPQEVTNEHSQMVILKPDNPVFTWPNKIASKDFNGWVEERGSKFMTTWSPHYEALLETHDSNQAPQKGGLLYARYGKGIYIYDAYAFYRQLPAGVPGAYRIFANLLSLPKNPNVK